MNMTMLVGSWQKHEIPFMANVRRTFKSFHAVVCGMPAKVKLAGQWGGSEDWIIELRNFNTG